MDKNVNSMRLLAFVAIMIVSSIAAMAQTRVVDTKGEAMTGAVVLDKSGTPIGVVDQNGTMPEVGAECFPLTLRCMGYEDTNVQAPSETIVMSMRPYEMSEVVVKPGDRPACRIICYIRETAGMNNSVDTMRLTAQYMADYLLPISKEAKSGAKWEYPRILNKQLDLYSNNGQEVDKSDIGIMSMVSIMRVGAMRYKLPTELEGQSSGTVTRKNNKTGCDAAVYKLTPSQYTIFADMLAGYKDHKYSPAFLKVFGLTLDFNEFWCRTSLRHSADGDYDIHDLVATTYSMKMLGRGKLFHTIFGGKNPVGIHSYVEIFPVAIEYLTKEEAKALKKEKRPTYPMVIPDAAR